MPISFKHKIIFIHIPKNAGTAITNGLDMTDIGHHYPNYYKTKYPKEWDTFVKFAVIRNPWDRVVSNYEYARLKKSYWHSSEGNSKHFDYDLLKNLSFKECVSILYTNKTKLRHQGWSNQTDYLKIDGKIIEDINLINFENLIEEIKNLTNIEIKEKVNSSNHQDYKNYYDIDLINKISEVYYEDIELLEKIIKQ